MQSIFDALRPLSQQDCAFLDFFLPGPMKPAVMAKQLPAWLVICQTDLAIRADHRLAGLGGIKNWSEAPPVQLCVRQDGRAGSRRQAQVLIFPGLYVAPGFDRRRGRAQNDRNSGPVRAVDCDIASVIAESLLLFE